MEESILEVRDLRKRFNVDAGFFAHLSSFVDAVRGVSFTIRRGETFGLVGESGCGKTTTARLVMGMYRADSGRILYTPSGGQTQDAARLTHKDLLAYRRSVKYIFQDPARSLNPRMKIREILCWPYLRSLGGTQQEAAKKAAAILEEVGLESADIERRPADFSGGQRQRISIARALLLEPELLICDEVVSALDVSVQAQILNLLLDIRQRRRLSALFITHDLKVACYFCDRLAVMRSGEILEEAEAATIYRNAKHPYTKALFAA